MKLDQWLYNLPEADAIAEEVKKAPLLLICAKWHEGWDYAVLEVVQEPKTDKYHFWLNGVGALSRDTINEFDAYKFVKDVDLVFPN